MRFAGLYNSNRAGKKFMIWFEDPNKIIHFGSAGSLTYLDHGDKKKRENYIKRHAANENWNEINAGSLSRYILWGDSKSLSANLYDFLDKFKINY